MEKLDRIVGKALEQGGLWSELASQKLDERLSAELPPAETSPRARHRMLAACTGCALVAGIVATSVFELQRPTQSPTRWPSAVFDTAPSVLLAGK